MTRNAAMQPPAEPLAAIWHDGASAAAHSVLVFFRPDMGELRLCPPDGASFMQPLAVWPLARVHIQAGGAGGPLRLTLQPSQEQSLNIELPEAADRARAWLRPLQQAKRNSLLRRWALVAVGGWLLCFALYLSSPVLFSAAAAMLPRSWELSLGQSSRASLARALQYLPGVRGENRGAGRSPALQGLLARLEAAVPTQDYVFDLMVLDADFVNAFALPGGYMLVSTGLIKDCATPDELAGVLAHEMVHVTERHGTARVLRHYAWAAVLRLAGGDTVAGDLALAALSSSFARDDEREADLLGAKRLTTAGINPMGMADFFGRLAQEGDLGGTAIYKYIASHPELAQRQAAIRRFLDEQEGGGGPYSPAMAAKDWDEFRALCGLPARPEPGEQPAPAPPFAPAPRPDLPPETGLESVELALTGPGHG